MSPTANRIIRWLGVLCVVILILAITLLSFPSQKEDLRDATDFSSFYCAAQIARQGLGSQLYDLRLQAAFQSKVAAVHAFYNHPPYEALVFVPFTYLSYRSAFFVWTFINLGLLAGSVFLIVRTTNVQQALAQYTRVPTDLGLVFAIFLTFAPVTTCLLLGEDSLLTLLIYSATFALFHRGDAFIAGCVLALALFKFQLVLPLVFVLLLRRKWSFLKGFSLSTALLVLLSMAVSGPQLLWQYPRFLLFESSHPSLAGFRPEFMPNLRGLMVWVASKGASPRIVIVLTASLSVLVLLWVARNWHNERLELSLSASVFATLLVSFHLYNYDLALLLLPVSILVGELASRLTLRHATAVNAAILILFIHPIHMFLLLHSMYAVMCAPVSFLLQSTVKLARDASKIGEHSDAAATNATHKVAD